MDWNFVGASGLMLVVNLVYAVVALFVGVAALRLMDRLLLKRMDLEVEIKRGNVAASIFASVLVLFVALIVGLALAK